MRRLSPTAIVLIALGVIVAALLVLMYVRGDEGQDRLSDEQVAGNGTATDPEQRCAQQATYDRIKRELFRRAAVLRGSDQAAYDQLASYAVLRAETPILREHDEETDRVSCSAYLSLDLPPGVAVVGGRRTLTAEVNYIVQPAADGSGTALGLSGADSIITPLATLTRTGAQPGQPLGPQMPAEDPLTNLPATEPPLADPAAEPEPGEPPASTSNPSFNCSLARTRGETAVCQSESLAALDRQMAAQFQSALSDADPAERTLLLRTRDRFLTYRDGCRSDDCIADAYRGRMTEIRDIMAGRWRPSR